VLLIGMCAAVSALVVEEPLRSIVYTLSAIQVLAAVVVSRVIHRTPIGLVVSVGLIGGTFAASSAVSGFLGDVLQLAGALFLIVGLILLLRQQQIVRASSVVVDGLIVGLGMWVLTWVAFVQPVFENSDLSLIETIVSGFYQPADAVILFLLVLLVFRGSDRSPSVLMLASGLGVMLAADMCYGLFDAGYAGDAILHFAYAFYIAAYSLVSAAFLHPSIAVRDEPTPVAAPQRLVTRLVVTTSALVVPVVVLALSGPADRTDRTIRAISAFVLAAAVTARVVESVRANARAQQRLLDQARIDDLTGLPSRTAVIDLLQAYTMELWRSDREPTVFLIDLDRFKNINDSLGHEAGDEALCIIAHRLVDVVPDAAMVARLSGDEFVVVDPTTRSLDEAAPLADRIQSIFREPVALAQGDVFLTASIGVASVGSISIKPERVLRNADTAMYRAKDSGRNCVAFFDDSMHERISHRLAVETALYRALDRRELRLFHQPILDIATGEVSGFEALMRWQQADGTIVSPAEFIPIAEETGTIVPIGAWALLEALTQLRGWIDDGICSPDATMSVNVSPRQLSDPNLTGIIAEAVQRSGVRPEQLWVEITESLMITDPESALARLRKIRELGVRLALDDFGTGYSSLSLLQRFPLQRLKIDRAFVRGIADNSGDQALVRTIIAMGHSLQLDMVAEGVETLNQLQVLEGLGCQKAQGYLISHPVPAEAMRTTVAGLERMGSFPLLRGSRRVGQL
jgi:diguanylate cyclase (GGDEF)-like protein